MEYTLPVIITELGKRVPDGTIYSILVCKESEGEIAILRWAKRHGGEQEKRRWKRREEAGRGGREGGGGE